MNKIHVLPLVTILSLAGPAQAAPHPIRTLLLGSGTVDLTHDTVTLPLHHGSLKDGRGVWFVLTDTDKPEVARSLGLAYAPSLSSASAVRGTRTAAVGPHNEFVFEAGSVDFAPRRNIVPGGAPAYFPPTLAQPGSVADADYSPFVKVTNQGGVIYNAPIIAFDVGAEAISFCDGNPDYDLVHDRVAAICPARGDVTLKLSHGFSGAAPVIYLSFDSNVPLAAAMEAATYAPADDALKNKGVSQFLFAVTNGETGAGNPARQGFDSALSGDGSPLNVLEGVISQSGYSPLWDVHVATWTPAAIASGRRRLLTNASSFYANEGTDGLMGTDSNGTLGSSGILVNCPVVGVLNE